MQDRGDELDLLLVALGELLGTPVGHLGDAEPLQPAERRLARLVRWLAVERGEVDELVEHAHPRIEPALLGQIPPGAPRDLGHGLAVPADLAVVGVEDAEADPHRGGLAGAVRAEEPEDLAARHAERQPVERERGGEPLRDVIDLEAHEAIPCGSPAHPARSPLVVAQATDAPPERRRMPR